MRDEKVIPISVIHITIDCCGSALNNELELLGELASLFSAGVASNLSMRPSKLTLEFMVTFAHKRRALNSIVCQQRHTKVGYAWKWVCLALVPGIEGTKK